MPSEFTLHEGGHTEAMLTLTDWDRLALGGEGGGRNAAGAGEEGDPASFERLAQV